MVEQCNEDKISHDIINKYISWIYSLCDVEKDSDLATAGLAIAKHHTMPELSEILGYEISEDTANELSVIWNGCGKEYFTYCCGNIFLNSFNGCTKGLFNKCCTILVNSVLHNG